jgi:hypothetical protein
MLDIITFESLFAGVVIYILAAFTSVFMRRNTEFMTPVIFGLMYGLYIGS